MEVVDFTKKHLEVHKLKCVRSRDLMFYFSKTYKKKQALLTGGMPGHSLQYRL